MIAANKIRYYKGNTRHDKTRHSTAQDDETKNQDDERAKTKTCPVFGFFSGNFSVVYKVVSVSFFVLLNNLLMNTKNNTNLLLSVLNKSRGLRVRHS